jgi:hypothetical protein
LLRLFFQFSLALRCSLIVDSNLVLHHCPVALKEIPAVRFTIIAIAVALVVVLSVSPASAQISYTATLNGGNEVPGNASPAIGTGTFILNAAQTALTFNVSFSGLTGGYTVAHFHSGATGVIGPPIRTMGPPPEGPATGVLSGVFNGTWATSDPESLTPWLNVLTTTPFGGQVPIYFNIHSSTFGGGEIRGQLVVVPEPMSLMLAGIGATGLAWRRFRWRNR